VTKPEAGFQLAWTSTYYPLDNSFVFQEGTPLSALPFNGSVAKVVNTFSGGGYWYITDDLSISGGLKRMYYKADSGNAEIDLSAGETASSITGVVTLQWERAFTDELTLGMSYGVPGYITDNPSNMESILSLMLYWALLIGQSVIIYRYRPGFIGCRASGVRMIPTPQHSGQYY
jgi:hypothetical protein